MPPEIWLPAMTRVQTEITVGDDGAAIASASAMQVALTEAEALLVDVLTTAVVPDPDGTIGDLLGHASRMLIVASDLGSTRSAQGRIREHAAAALRSELAAVEAAILEGETTYQLDPSQADRPMARASHALASLGDTGRSHVGDQLALRVASAELAALLVRAAANVETTGEPQHGAAADSDSLLGAITELVLKIAGSADELSPDRRTTGAVDHVGHSLCESLRVPVELASLDALGERAAGGAARHQALDGAHRAWMAIAAREYAVACSLDAQLPHLDYKHLFGSVSNAIAAGAVNLLCGGRLMLRPRAFRHRRAWGRQGIALSHAIEAYINGLRGDRDAVARAQLIVMSRLIKSVAALALIDAERQNLNFGNGRVRR